MRKIHLLLLALILLLPPTTPATTQPTITTNLILIPDTDPYYALIATPLSCYNTPTNTTITKPLLIHHNNTLTPQQHHFLHTYLNHTGHILSLGTTPTTNYTTTTFTGTPPQIAINTTLHHYTTAPTALILPYTTKDYHLNLHATLIASYQHIPLLLYHNNTQHLQNTLDQLNTQNLIIIGNITPTLTTPNQIHLTNTTNIQHHLLTYLTTHNKTINYLTITNPTDIQTPLHQNTITTTQTETMRNTQITLLGTTYHLKGTDTTYHPLTIPSGIQHITITTKNQPKPTLWSHLFPDHPALYITLLNPENNTVAYSSTMAHKPQHTHLETIAYNNPGIYTLKIKAYHGIKGGYFSLRGISQLNTNITITTKITEKTSPHHSFIPKLSTLAPYLTATHQGLLIANNSFSLTDNEYTTIANGTAAGPWYTEHLQNYSNSKVHHIITHLNTTLTQFDSYNLLNTYLEGPAWLALLGDTNMIPQYYYQPSQPSLTEKGLPSDNPYSLNHTLSVGRILNWNVADTSTLLARTIFYQTIAGPPQSEDPWHHTASFMYGEGFGETGGIFHQIPYAKKLKNHNFTTHVYGDLKNSRQYATDNSIFINSNIIEYLGHGDWFWFTPSLYGLDFFHKAFDVAHLRNWQLPKPSVMLTSACLMGRIDGIPPDQSIGLSFLHAGCTAFVGATRETGSEAGLETLEDHLLIDNWSIGEALRGEKQIDQELPTYYVRTLYGDPAFNPYEPDHGFN